MSEKKWDFKHTETDTQNLTTVNMGSSDGKKTAEELKKKYEKRSILVKIKDDNGVEQEFYAVDFKTFTDHAGDPVLHFKFKKKNLILYLTTPHPDSLKCLQDLKNSVLGFTFKIEIRDFTEDIKEMLRMLQQKEGLDLKDGIHPGMKDYLKDELE